MKARLPLALSLAIALSSIAASSQVATLLDQWFKGPDQVHQAVLLHETDPLGKTAKEIRPILMAHYKEVDYIVCGDVVGPLMESKNEVHEVIAWQIIFASGDWVEQHPDQAKDIDAYTLAGLESGMRSYAAVLKAKPRAKHKLLDELLGLYEAGNLPKWAKEHPCRAQ